MRSTSRKRRKLGESQLELPLEQPAEKQGVTNEVYERGIKLGGVVEEAYNLNKQYNLLKRRYDKLRKEILEEMRGLKLDSFSVDTDGGENIVAVVESKPRTVVDVELLAKEASEEDFRAMVSATVTKVKEVVGENVLNRVAKVEEGAENVSIKKQ